MFPEKIIFALIFVVVCSFGTAFATEPIMITISPDVDQAVFDGKWSFMTEWKRTSEDTFWHGATPIYLRTAHEGNFIYVLIDDLAQTNFVKGSDNAIVCFDTNSNKTIIPDSDDYCFVAVLGNNNGFVLQGGSPLAISDHFKKIPSPSGFIAVGGISDENDRYSPVPHKSYEYRIPTDLIGRADVYGFYMNVYDVSTNESISYPGNVTANNSLHIASPKDWGEMISPDKTLPEFPWPSLILVPALFVVIYFTKIRRSFSMNS